MQEGLSSLNSIIPNVLLENDLKSFLKHFETSKNDIPTLLKEKDTLKKRVISEKGISQFKSLCYSDDPSLKERHEFCVQNLIPLMEQVDEAVNQKILESPVLKGSFEGSTFIRNIGAQSRLYSVKNFQLKADLTSLEKKTDSIQSSLVFEWNGEKLPRARIGPYILSQNREDREKAYWVIRGGSKSISSEIDSIFEKCVAIRHQLAKNTDFRRYQDYRFLELKRFDYSPEDSEGFCESVHLHIVPLWLKCMERRIKFLGLTKLRPWDIECAYDQRPPLRICEAGDFKALQTLALDIIESIFPSSVYEFAKSLFEEGWVDGLPRAHKFGGGLMHVIPAFERTVICMNSNGLIDNFLTLVHELGHCIHYFLGKDLAPYDCQTWSNELAEVGSLSLEWLALEKLQKLRPDLNLSGVFDAKIEKVIKTFCYTAALESFQHWVYQNPEAKETERNAHYLTLLNKFLPEVERSDIGETEAIGWQIVHVLRLPFYMIDYSIADMAALHLWRTSKPDEKEAVRLYMQGCSLAGSKPLPELFKAFGIDFDLSSAALSSIGKFLESALLNPRIS